MCEIFGTCTRLITLIMDRLEKARVQLEVYYSSIQPKVRVVSEQVDSPLPSSHSRHGCLLLILTGIWFLVLSVYFTPLPTAFPKKVFLDELLVQDSQKLVDLLSFHTQLCSPHEPDWLTLTASWLGAKEPVGSLGLHGRALYWMVRLLYSCVYWSCCTSDLQWTVLCISDKHMSSLCWLDV